MLCIASKEHLLTLWYVVALYVWGKVESLWQTFCFLWLSQ